MVCREINPSREDVTIDTEEMDIASLRSAFLVNDAFVVFLLAFWASDRCPGHKIICGDQRL